MNGIMKKTILLLWNLLVILTLYGQPDPGYYIIRSQATGQHLQVPSDQIGQNSTQLYLGQVRKTVDQVWRLEKNPDGSYHIFQAGSGKAMDASWHFHQKDNCPIILWDANGGQTQKWHIVRSARAGHFSIRLAVNGHYLTAKKKGSHFTNQVALFKSNRLDGQVFSLKKIDFVVRSPKYVDLRAHQTPYRDQGPRGTCTYFASLAALEAAYKRSGYGEVDLSEEYYAIVAKMFGLHTNWADIRHANYRENQFGTTQGGGTVEGLKNIRIPEEHVAPYVRNNRPVDWRNKSQKACNDFNFSVLTEKMKTASRYYYARSTARIHRINASELEKVLLRGYEIKIGINRGAHVILLVGYDITDPDNKRFIIKNSYGPNGQPANSQVDYLPYAEIGEMVDAEYITAVHKPAAWPELKAVGRWNLNYDGWRGTLDIYRLPGISDFVLDDHPRNRGIRDRRLGVFYDHQNKAYRVNGAISAGAGGSLRVTFYIDKDQPNLRWDKLQGRRFTYVLNRKGDFMAGFHRDPDGRSYAGYAKKSALLNARKYTTPPTHIRALAGTRSQLHAGTLEGQIRFSGVRRDHAGQVITDYEGHRIRAHHYVEGTLQNGRSQSYVRIYEVPGKKNSLYFMHYTNASRNRLRQQGPLKFLSWDNGILAGISNRGVGMDPVVLAQQ